MFYKQREYGYAEAYFRERHVKLEPEVFATYEGLVEVTPNE